MIPIDHDTSSWARIVFIAVVVGRLVFGKKCQVCYGSACYISAD